MARFSGKGSMSSQTVLVTVPNEIPVYTGKDGNRFTNLKAELSMLPGHNEGRVPQEDARLSRVNYKDAEGKWQENDKAPYDIEVFDKLKDCPSVPAINSKTGEEYGRIYSVEADLQPRFSHGKACGVAMKVDTIKPGPELPENTQELQFAQSKIDRAAAKTEKDAAKEAEAVEAEVQQEGPDF